MAYFACTFEVFYAWLECSVVLCGAMLCVIMYVITVMGGIG